MKRNNVRVRSGTPVVGIAREGNVLTGVKIENGKVIRGRAIVIAVGGTSRPETGSTGDGYTWLKHIGHTIVQPVPSLVPIAMKDAWVKQLAGVSIAGVKISVFQNNKKQEAAKGKILFTHVGISGPTVLNMSKDVGELLKYGEVVLSLDLLPAQDHGMLDTALQKLFKEHDKKKFRNVLSDIVPAAIVPVIVELSGIDKEIQCNSISREERKALGQLLKGIPMRVDKLLGVEKAIITSGGVIPEEVDFKTMRSRLFLNLYLAGDILHINRPSGGYSLQLCWTTGFVAGDSAGKV